MVRTTRERDRHDEDLQDGRQQVLDGRDALDALLGHELGDLGVLGAQLGLLRRSLLEQHG